MRLLRITMAFMLASGVIFASFVYWQGSRPMGEISSATGVSNELQEISYWEYLKDRLDANSRSPANCRRSRLIFLTIAVPVYPIAYTYVALYPDSILSSHVQPDPRIPQRITWQKAPLTWWNLVKEFTWMAFTQPLMNYRPAVGQKVGIDRTCTLPVINP